jgi:hypothetical protein
MNSILKDARFSELYKKNKSASFEQTVVVRFKKLCYYDDSSVVYST